MYGNGPLLNNRLYWHPFALEEDGSIAPNPDGVEGVRHSSRRNGDSVVHVFEYARPSLRHLETASVGDIESKPHTERGVVTVTLTPASIVVHDEIAMSEAQRREAVAHYDEEAADGKGEFLPSAARTELAVADGECVPWEQSQILAHRENPETKAELLIFYTPLCKDIADFLEERPEAGAWFDRDLNDQIDDVLVKHWGRLSKSEWDDHREAAEIAPAFAPTPFMVYPKLVVQGGFIARTERNFVKKRMLGFTRVIAANVALAHCYSHGLWDSLHLSDAFWESREE